MLYGVKITKIKAIENLTLGHLVKKLLTSVVASLMTVQVPVERQ
jgi:hypothetical protein